LSRVAPGTAIVIQLADGRRLERYMVGTTADSLSTVNLSGIASRDRRAEILQLVCESPHRYMGAVSAEENGAQVPIAQRFDRATILMVSRPKSVVVRPPAPLSWMLHYAGPCPNCDSAQTAVTGETVLPSPLPRKAETDPLLGEVLYRAPAASVPQALDDLTWEQLRLVLPASLRGK
jgi:hypothetical protein